MKNIYLDTNAFYFFFFEHSEYTRGIKKVFEKMQEGEYKGITNCLTLDELAYVILMRLIARKYRKHPMKVLRESRSVILEFVSDIREVFDVVFSFDNLEIMGADENIVGLIPIVMDENLLLPRDCIHLRTMLDCDCDLILSTDADFDHIKDIKRLRPEEI